MTVIGLTGTIASGKSLVSTILKDLGARVVDADLVAREVVEPGTPGWEEVVNTFGSKILKPDQTIDRKALGAIVFDNPGEMEKLNAITHPLIIDKIRREIEEYQKAEAVSPQTLVIDAPLLIETGLHRLVDEVWVVDVPENVRIDRLMKRDGLSGEQAVKRIRSQMPAEEKKKYAGVVIDNSGDKNDTRKAVEQIWNQRFGKSGV